jgi:hypothetical protein
LEEEEEEEAENDDEWHRKAIPNATADDDISIFLSFTVLKLHS